LVHPLLYAVPLVIAISLVWAATRHEEILPILRQSLGCAGSMTCLLLLVLALLAIWPFIGTGWMSLILAVLFLASSFGPRVWKAVRGR
jgi:hypothetical protein